LRQSDISPFARDALDRLILDSFELESSINAIAISLAQLDTGALPGPTMLTVLEGLRARFKSARKDLDVVTLQVSKSVAVLSADSVESQSSSDRPAARSKRDAATASKDRKLSTTPVNQGKAGCVAVV